jgi:hypothetical protein
LGKKPILVSSICLLLILPGGVFAKTELTQNSTNNAPLAGSNTQESFSSLAITNDIDGPILVSATVSPSTANVGDTLTINAQVTDEGSGVSKVIAYLNTIGGFKSVSLTFDSASGN